MELSFFFIEKGVLLGFNFAVKCTVSLYLFVTVGKTSIQLVSPFSKTAFSQRFLMVPAFFWRKVLLLKYI